MCLNLSYKLHVQPVEKGISPNSRLSHPNINVYGGWEGIPSEDASLSLLMVLGNQMPNFQIWEVK